MCSVLLNLFPVRKREAVTQGGARGIDCGKCGKCRDLVSSKAERTRETMDAFSYGSLTRISIPLPVP